VISIRIIGAVKCSKDVLFISLRESVRHYKEYRSRARLKKEDAIGLRIILNSSSNKVDDQNMNYILGIHLVIMQCAA
jgi:hypothetical protein